MIPSSRTTTKPKATAWPRATRRRTPEILPRHMRSRWGLAWELPGNCASNIWSNWADGDGENHHRSSWGYRETLRGVILMIVFVLKASWVLRCKLFESRICGCSSAGKICANPYYGKSSSEMTSAAIFRCDCSFTMHRNHLVDSFHLFGPCLVYQFLLMVPFSNLSMVTAPMHPSTLCTIS